MNDFKFKRFDKVILNCDGQRWEGHILDREKVSSEQAHDGKEYNVYLFSSITPWQTVGDDGVYWKYIEEMFEEIPNESKY